MNRQLKVNYINCRECKLKTIKNSNCQLFCSKKCQQKNYYKRKKDILIKQNHEWYIKNKNKRKIYRKIDYIKNKERQQKQIKKLNKEYRLKVLIHYSGNPPKCQCCDEKILEFLSIDHINGKGNKHRKLIGNRLCRWIIRNDYPKEFQILCHNCNQAKGFYGECPHKKIRSEKNMNEIRQGDVLLKLIEKIPNDLKEKDTILAKGESTGHFHQLVGDVQVMVDNKGNQFAQVNNESQLVHQEHHVLTVPKGRYAVIQQREVDLVGEIRQVND